MLLCKKCGKEIPENSEFCPYCGEVFGESEAKLEESNSEVSDEIQENADLAKESEICENTEDSEKTEGISENLTDSQQEIYNAEQSVNYDFDGFVDGTKKKGTEKFIKGLLLAVIGIIIAGTVCVSAITIYNNSPEKIFEKVKESESFEKYIAKKGYNVSKYYVADILGNDGKKELLLEVDDKSDGISRKMIYIAEKDDTSGNFRIGTFGGMGGEFIESIEMSMALEDEKGFFVSLKNFSEISQEDIDSIKLQIGIESDDEARNMLESMYGGTGLEQYAVFNMIDYTFVNYGEKNAEMNSSDFIFGLTPEKVLIKNKDSQTGEFKYQYIDVNDNSLQNGENDNSVSEDEFNKYIEEFKSGKEPLESFEVPQE